MLLENGKQKDAQVKSGSRKKKLAIAFTLIAVVAGGVAGLVVYLVNKEPEDTFNPETVQVQLPAAGESVTIEVDGKPTFLNVALSRVGELSTAVTPQGKPLARSYDAGEWESVKGEFVTCSTESKICSVPVNGASSRVLFESPTREVIKSVIFSSVSPPAMFTDKEERLNSRMLLQASFGPTRESLNDLKDDGSDALRFRKWIETQFDLPPSLHRSYYRARANPRTMIAVPPGSPRPACAVNSRWQRLAFTGGDVGKILEVTDQNSYAELTVDGFVRHHETNVTMWSTVDPNLAPFTICSVEEQLEGTITFGEGCKGEFANTFIHFETAPEAARLLTVQASQVRDLTPPVANTKLLTTPPVDCSTPELGPVFLSSSQGEYLLHDSRLEMVENTDEAPAQGTLDKGSQLLCPSVARSIINLESCVVSKGTCQSTQFANKMVELNANNIRTFYRAGGKFVYAIENLSADDVSTPCRRSSRWMFQQGSCGDRATSMGAETNATLYTALVESFALDGNPLMRDIQRLSGACVDDEARLAKLDVVFEGQTYCFEQVHSDLLNVYDFSFWSMLNAHPGNRDALQGGRPNPIQKFALDGETTLVFPSWHPMNRWEWYKNQFEFVGRLGDQVNFRQLPSSVQSEAIAKEFGALAETPINDPTQSASVTCGSPGEVASRPELGSRFSIGMASSSSDTGDAIGFDESVSRQDAQGTVWAMQSLFSADQLRQRVAWALSQILVVATDLTQGDSQTEIYLAYYDIFVRRAFGNYKDILREVSYSPLMGQMLSFLNSKSMSYSLERERKASFPDENYAREIMQLFTMGPWKLHPNGTEVRDAKGKLEATYDNEDIMTFARAWTGFERQVLRGNIEAPDGIRSRNYLDSMKIVGPWRDPFPKLGLDKTYIGDTYPLCEDLPDKAFLRKGATFRFLGTTPSPELHTELADLSLPGEKALRMNLNPQTSSLFKKLCNADSTDLKDCNFQATVELSENLPCDGKECDVDTVRLVMLPNMNRRCPEGTVLDQNLDIGDSCKHVFVREETFSCPTGCEATNDDSLRCVAAGTSTPCKIDTSEYRGIYFEYVQPPCVHQVYYNNARRINNHYSRSAMCANPKSIAASESCCEPGNAWTIQQCRYGGEYMKYSTAQNRCKNDFSYEVCDFRWMWFVCPDRPQRVWTDAPCNVQVKVRDDGKIAIVHDVSQAPKTEDTKTYMRQHVAESTENWFRALWAGGSFPNAGESNCGGGECQRLPAVPGGNPTCLCNVTVDDGPVFKTMPPSKQSMMETLFIGAPDVNSFDAGTYSLAESSGGITVYHKVGAKPFDENTIFKIDDGPHGTKFLRNVRSIVRVKGAQLSFRNPPTFHDLAGIEARDAMYETEAVLEHYMQNPSTPPFLAKKLIQHFVTSNPSPRYVEVVAKAFRDGTYSGLGSNKYGDLKATIAAILLDKEARNPLLDLDPAFGQFREPILKVIHFLRGMQMVPKETLLVLRNLDQRFGMEPLNAPNVFSFYEAAFSPAGKLQDAGLVAPEAQLLNEPLLIASINALFSTVKYGLSDCRNGFGSSPGQRCGDITRDETHSLSSGRFSLSFDGSDSVEEILNELDLLLTGGRLDDRTRGIFKTAYETQVNETASSTLALRAVQQLFLTSAQFHSSNQCIPSDKPRTVRSWDDQKSSNADKPYKAIVYVMLQGGADSFNLLVPHSGCSSKDLYQQYSSVRDIVALSKENLLEIDASQSGQPCSKFGVHPSLPFVKDLYDAGDAVFMANTGVLVEPVTKDGPEERPEGLFAHNIQVKAVESAYPQDSSQTIGVLGRAMDMLATKGYGIASFSVSGNAPMLNGKPGVSRPVDVVNFWSGVQRLDLGTAVSDVVPDGLEDINEKEVSSLFGQTFSSVLSNALNRSEELGEALEQASLKEEFIADNGLARQLRQAALMIDARKTLGSNRNSFYTAMGGFDTHDDAQERFAERLGWLNDALREFVEELKSQGLWNDVVVVVGSEFGRTLTSNGVGTDHGWGGNYLMVGGGLKGGRILGKFPDDLTDSSPLNLGRGRLIPTTSWDQIWNGVLQWFGVESEDLDYILPNRANFESSLYSATDLFN